MIENLMAKVLAGALAGYGRDAAGNVVLSESSIREVSHKVVALMAPAIERPVITITISDVFNLAQQAGFVVKQTVNGFVQEQNIYDASSQIKLDAQVTRIVELAVQFALEAVERHTKPSTNGVGNG